MRGLSDLFEIEMRFAGLGLSERIMAVSTYLLEFMRALKGCDEIFSSMGRLTEGMGTLEMPLS
jgi:hypothetical protein